MTPFEEQATLAARDLANDLLVTMLLNAHFRAQPDPDAAAQAMLQLCDEKVLDVESGLDTGDPQADMYGLALFQRFVREKVEAALALSKPASPGPRGRPNRR